MSSSAVKKRKSKEHPVASKTTFFLLKSFKKIAQSGKFKRKGTLGSLNDFSKVKTV